MATSAENLAVSLQALHDLQQKGNLAIRTDEISRTHRERLVRNGFLKEVIRGWYLISSPEEKPGDTTFWYSNFWHFCARFLQDKYGEDWCLSPEQSILLHAGNWSVPPQLIVKSPTGGNFKMDLLHETSIFSIKSELPAKNQTVNVQGIYILTAEAALIHTFAAIYTAKPTDIRTVLSLIKDSSQVLSILLAGGHSSIAGRLAGAFRNNNQHRIAADIMKTMEAAGYNSIRESDPFSDKLAITLSEREKSPYVNRIRLMWQAMRETVITNFPKAPATAPDAEAYMKQVEDIYVTDAYHSLSIEKYKVTPELIERVRTGSWNYQHNEEDKRQRDAMAARGYWQAFQRVEESIKKILHGANAAMVADEDYRDWYRELFAPSVAANILKPMDLAGFRNQQVYISGSMHVPLNYEAVRETMQVLFELLGAEPEAGVRAVLGHFIFVYIHPYMDGNGRMGRFLLNVMLASGGYPWTVIPVEERKKYMEALEQASIQQDIKPFTEFIAYLVTEGLNGQPVAKI